MPNLFSLLLYLKNISTGAIRNNYDAIDAEVTEWTNRYSDDPQEALAELIQFVLHSSGCVKAKFTKNDLKMESRKHVDIVDHYNKDPFSDDAIKSKKDLYIRKFNADFTEVCYLNIKY